VKPTQYGDTAIITGAKRTPLGPSLYSRPGPGQQAGEFVAAADSGLQLRPIDVAFDGAYRQCQSLGDFAAGQPLTDDGDVVEADAAIERLAAAPAEGGFSLARHLAVESARSAARAHGDEAPYREYRDRYRDMAKTLGFEGHTAWVGAMIEDRE
jgi:hypothetical protein